MQAILPLIPAGATSINNIVSVWRGESSWTYFLGCHPVYEHAPDDLRMFRFCTALLINTGNCKSCEIMKVFGVSKSSIDRSLRLVRKDGVQAFFKQRARRGSCTIMTPEIISSAQLMLNEFYSRRTISDELQISYSTLSKAIQDGRLNQPKLPLLVRTKSERSLADAAAAAGMGTACTRTSERLLCAVGELSGAKTDFEACHDVPHGGVICALPALLSNGLLSGIKALGKLGGYYQKTHILLLLAFMALSRIKTVEKLRGVAQGEMGKLIGLDRIPEVRCLREKMDQLSEGESTEEWAAELGRMWMESDPESAGTLYVDGHVRVYHGSKTKPPRKFVSRQRLCLRGVNDYWINDAIGRPFFVVDKVVDPGMIEVLRDDIVPRLLKEVPSQPTQEQLDTDPCLSRFALVFDREGYSPAFFRDMWCDHRIGCITYHKHPGSDWPESEFVEQSVTMPRGESVTIKLAERGSLVGSGQNTIWMREVRKLTESGHQTSLISTLYDADHTVLAARMFTRWCQENFFSYMMQHFAIDTLNEYSYENIPDTEKVVNPSWRALKKQQASLVGKLKTSKVRFAELTLESVPENDVAKFEKWVKKKAIILEELQALEHDLEELKSKIKGTDSHIKWSELDEKDSFKKPGGGRKRLMDAIRMIAYRAETAMAALLVNRTIDSTAARRLLQDLFKTEIDIMPDKKQQILRINVHHGSRPAADREMSKLFEQLNATEIIYPGTDLKLVYGFVNHTKQGSSVTIDSTR
jgi:hypothetical protein